MISDTQGTYEVSSDGRSCWVNGPLLVARFGPKGWEAAKKPGDGYGVADSFAGEPTTSEWRVFVEVVYKRFGVKVAPRHRPTWVRP